MKENENLFKAVALGTHFCSFNVFALSHFAFDHYKKKKTSQETRSIRNKYFEKMTFFSIQVSVFAFNLPHAHLGIEKCYDSTLISCEREKKRKKKK